MKNIDSNTITTSQFQYLGNSNQDIKTTSNILLNNVDTPLYMNVRNYSVTSIPNYTFFGVSGDCKFYNNLYLPLCYPNYNLTIDSDNKINCETKNYYLPSSSISWNSLPENKYEANTVQDIKTDSEVVFNKLQINSLNFPVSSSILYGGTSSTTYETFTTGTPVPTSTEGRFSDVTVSGNTYTIALQSSLSSTVDRYGMRSKDGFRPTDYTSVEFIFNIKRFYQNNIYIGFCRKTTDLSTTNDMNNTGNNNDQFKVVSLASSPDVYRERNTNGQNITSSYNTGFDITLTTSNIDKNPIPAYKFNVTTNGNFTIQYRSSPTSSWQNVSLSIGTQNIDPNVEWCAMIWDNSETGSKMIVEFTGTKTTASTSYVGFDSTGNFTSSSSTPYARYVTISNPSTNLWNIKTYYDSGYNPTTLRFGARTRTADSFRFADYNEVRATFTVNEWSSKNMYLGFLVSGKSIYSDIDMNGTSGYNCYFIDLNGQNTPPDNFNSKNTTSNFVKPLTTNITHPTTAGDKYRIRVATDGSVGIDFYQNSTSTWTNNVQSTTIPNLPTTTDFDVMVWDNNFTPSNAEIDVFVEKIAASTPATTLITSYVGFDSTGNFSSSGSTPYARYVTISNPSTNLWNVKTYNGSGYNPTTLRFGARTRTADSFRFADYSEVRATFTINEWSEKNMYIGFLISGKSIYSNIDMNNTAGYNCYFIDLNTLNNDPDNFNSKNTTSNFVIPLSTNIQYSHTAGDKYVIKVATNGSVDIDYYNATSATWTNNVQSLTIPNLPTTTDFDVFVWDNNGTSSKADIDVFVEKIITTVGKIEKDNENLYVHTSSVIKKLQLTTI